MRDAIDEGALRHERTIRARWARPLAVVWAAVAVFVAVDVLRFELDLAGARALAVTGVVSVVVYAAAWRPAVVVDDDAVVLRNLLRDVRAPWPAVEDVETVWVLSLVTAGRRFVALAVSARNPTREGGAFGVSGLGSAFNRLGMRGVEELVEGAEDRRAAAPSRPSEEVLDRWMRRRGTAAPGPVVVTWQWPLIVAGAAALLLLAVTLLLH